MGWLTCAGEVLNCALLEECMLPLSWLKDLTASLALEKKRPI